jgi:translocation and assembly module TamB
MPLRQVRTDSMELAPKRYRTGTIVAGAGGALLVIGAGWLWIERTPIASTFINDALVQRGVSASYKIARIGFRTQRIEHIRIGDPNHPDLTADWAEIGMTLGLGGVSVRSVDAGGVRLRGRLLGGRLSFGAVDRLLPQGETGKAPALPDMALGTRDARLTLETPQGVIRARLDGKGGLHGGYRGRLLLAADALSLGGCRLAAAHAMLAISIEENRPALSGPADAATMICTGRATLTRPVIDVEAQAGADLLHWKGNVVVQQGRLASASGTVAKLGGRIGFDAAPDRIKGGGSVTATGVVLAQARAAMLAFDGEYDVDPKARSASVAGDLDMRGGGLAPAQAQKWFGAPAGLGGTPIGPVALAWGTGLRRAAASFDGRASLSVEAGPKGGVARIERLDASSASGARLLLRSERVEGLVLSWPGTAFAANGSVEFGGGGLPEARISLRQPVPGAPVTGSATIAPYRADNALLALDPVQFGPAAGGGTLVHTKVTMDGPLADGRVEGLSVPVSAYLGKGGALAINRACAPLRFDRLAIAGAVVGEARLTLCPSGGALFGRTAAGVVFGGARIAGPRLIGKVGDQPLTMAARSIAVTMTRPGFALDALSVRLGKTASPTRLDIDHLQGGLDRDGIAGRFTGLSGKIGAVPLLVSKGEGVWQLASSVLTLKGGVQVTDADQGAPRFLPLVSDDLLLTLRGGRIAVNGTLKEPASHAVVTGITIDHDLSSGRGEAQLDVKDLRFVKKGLQPERITPLTLGVIANVEGAVAGQGRIRWAGGNVTSDGQFHTDGINFAAAFGPVTGLKGTIHFTDLLGLVTAPDQLVTVAEINPGISVVDGVIHYRLLANQKLALTDGKWPFSGGALTLDPSVLDMANPVPRRLTFRLAGFDAATFMQQLDFKNISVTGKFDGELPIIFDAQGGRIENGHLTVRKEGGTLAYVGDVTNANLGKMARVAFDALKFMRYERLTILLNGSLDGEIVSKVLFDGTKDQTKSTTKSSGLIGRIIAPITRLPFRFNITITAPFRGLVNSAQTFADPSILLQQVTPVSPPANQPAPIHPR